MYYTYILLGIALLPMLLIRLWIKGIKTPAYRKRIKERLGFIDKSASPIIWIHCVSVGEFMAARTLIDALIVAYPQHQILITSTTKTGSDAIKKTYQNQVLHYYFPFDIIWIIRRYIRQINPAICILLETEIWVNLLFELRKNHIPAILINARLSDLSLQKYQKFAPKLIKKTINKLSLIATQNQASSDNFSKLGAANNIIKTIGNLKFDQNPTLDSDTTNAIKKMLGEQKIIVFASTHRGEEAQIIKAYLAQTQPLNAVLIIIPRHPERFDEVYNLIKKHKIKVAKRSDNQPILDAKIMLGDSLGEMLSYFEVADITFIGGSLSNTGGHNMLEPASLKKPIIFGPNTHNFTQIATDLIQQNAAIRIQTAPQLFTQIHHLLTHPTTAKTLSTNAHKYFKTHQGTTQKLIPIIQKLIPPK